MNNPGILLKKILIKMNYYKIRLLLCFFSIALSLFMAEIIIRKTLPRPYIFKTARSADSVTQYGFIDEDVLKFAFPQKTDDQKYILFVGDSFLVQCNFVTVFNTLLNKGENKEKYILNDISTSGWGTDQEYTAFRNLVYGYKPDFVILTFCLWNDIANNLSAFHLKEGIKPYFIIKNGKLVLCRSGKRIDKNITVNNKNKVQKLLYHGHYNLCRVSYVYFYITRVFEGDYRPLFFDKQRNIDGRECPFNKFNYFIKTKKNPYMFTDRISHYLAMIKNPKPVTIKDGRKIYIAEYGYRLTELILKQFNKDVSSYGGKFYVLLLPLANGFGWQSENSEVTFKQADGQQVTLDFMYQINRLKSLCEKNGIKVIDFTKDMEMRFRDSSELIRSVDDIHYNQLGDAWLGSQLYKYFKDNI